MGNLGEIVLPQAGRFNCQSSTPDECETADTCLAARNGGNACPSARLAVLEVVSVAPVNDREIQDGKTQCIYSPPCQNVCELSEITRGRRWCPIVDIVLADALESSAQS